MMKVNRCNPANCAVKEKCNHYLIDGDGIFEVVNEDLSDICKGKRLFIEGKYYGNFSSKEAYEELLDFYDNTCPGTESHCESRERYDVNEGSSCIDCQYGKHEEFSCNHDRHPVNIAIFSGFAFIMAENKAFEEAGIEYGRVEFTCPICGGTAVGNRYRGGALGSGCQKCGFRHT